MMFGLWKWGGENIPVRGKNIGNNITARKFIVIWEESQVILYDL